MDDQQIGNAERQPGNGCPDPQRAAWENQVVEAHRRAEVWARVAEERAALIRELEGLTAAFAPDLKRYAQAASQLQQTNIDLATEGDELRAQIAELTRREADLSDTHATLSATNAELSARLNAVQEQLALEHATLGWRFLERLRRVFPNRTVQGRLARIPLRLVRKIKKQAGSNTR